MFGTVFERRVAQSSSGKPRGSQGGSGRGRALPYASVLSIAENQMRLSDNCRKPFSEIIVHNPPWKAIRCAMAFASGRSSRNCAGPAYCANKLSWSIAGSSMAHAKPEGPNSYASSANYPRFSCSMSEVYFPTRCPPEKNFCRSPVTRAGLLPLVTRGVRGRGSFFARPRVVLCRTA